MRYALFHNGLKNSGERYEYDVMLAVYVRVSQRDSSFDNPKIIFPSLYAGLRELEIA